MDRIMRMIRIRWWDQSVFMRPSEISVRLAVVHVLLNREDDDVLEGWWWRSQVTYDGVHNADADSLSISSLTRRSQSFLG